MPASKHIPAVRDELIIDKIYLVRGQKIMIDRDLADLYGVETRALKQAVRRNITRFPEDFMFEMNKEEFENWRTQNASSKKDRQGLRYAPFCFTEQGVTMLSCILNSERAITVNIRLIRIFARMREALLAHKDILLKLEQLERKVTGHDEDIARIFECLKQLLQQPEQPRTRIGFRLTQE
ncbi:ORF6N domain-containing protein [Chitinophaga alhagiae]|uniref:ORF6N domain-containing protein n=1 Tax=Chitinophaga alhagiae TaxID=2203219 RepID=UPI0018E587DC|nr:ORF6N domain-containing protein [Chitinophaga alhagiae]